MNPTNNPALRSFVPVAAEAHFPIQNLPFGVFGRGHEPARVGVAIGDFILDLSAVQEDVLPGHRVFSQGSLNAFLALGRPAWTQARNAISRLLRADEPTLRDNVALRRRALVPMADAELLLPVDIGDYTDFYSSREHASN